MPKRGYVIHSSIKLEIIAGVQLSAALLLHAPSIVSVLQSATENIFGVEPSAGFYPEIKYPVTRCSCKFSILHIFFTSSHPEICTAAVTEWYRYLIVAGFVSSWNPVPLQTHRVGQRCTLNLSRAETSSRWCGVVVRRGGASSGVVHIT
ncbi:uncharacterized protein TNCV_4554081 [Trichonephila clavipes]|nr:uncharacterized protein TNCV_4554081 [Trichonephila clavipes]